MYFCPNCGKQVTKDDQFCPFCGYRLLEDGKNDSQTEQADRSSKKVSIFSNKKYVVIEVIIIVLLVIFGVVYWNLHRQQSDSTTATPISQSSTKSTQSSNSSVSSTSESNKSSSLWNSSKGDQLTSFINSWAPTMNQSYAQLAQSDYDFTGQQQLVNGSTADMGWSTDGRGNYDYNVVAVFNYNKNVTAASTKIGEYHITYAFAFHDGQPVALVSQTTNGYTDWTETKNNDVKTNFTKIADGNG